MWGRGPRGHAPEAKAGRRTENLGLIPPWLTGGGQRCPSIGGASERTGAELFLCLGLSIDRIRMGFGVFKCELFKNL
jgi:hypothetical protein